VSDGNDDGAASAGRASAADLLDHIEVEGHVGGEFVRCGVGVADRPSDDSIPLEQEEVMTDGSIVEGEGRGKEVGVLRALEQFIEDPAAIRTSAGPDQEIPEQGSVRVGQRDPDTGAPISALTLPEPEYRTQDFPGGRYIAFPAFPSASMSSLGE
jgi:hypothetical protein